MISDDVGDRFPGGSSSHQRFVALRKSGWLRIRCGRAEEARRIPAKDVLGEQPGIEVGFVIRNTGGAETVPGRPDTEMN